MTPDPRASHETRSDEGADPPHSGAPRACRLVVPVTKPLLLDACCCEGGAAEGYRRAGFFVVGVDVTPQPRYAGDAFIHADIMDLLDTWLDDPSWKYQGWALEDFSGAHASPPCQMYSRHLKHMALPQPMLIDALRVMLNQTGLAWVMENVEGSPLAEASDLFGAHGATVCGTGLGLRVYRHRIFESSFPLTGTHCDHSLPAMNPHNQAGRDAIYREFGRQDPEKVWRREMGVEWMTKHGARECVPPAYTEFIGTQLLAHISAERPAA